MCLFRNQEGKKPINQASSCLNSKELAQKCGICLFTGSGKNIILYLGYINFLAMKWIWNMNDEMMQNAPPTYYTFLWNGEILQ